VIKRAFDCALAAVGLVVSSPFWIAIGAAITFDDGGPIFYRQARVGLGGRQFDALKFRSTPKRAAGRCRRPSAIRASRAWDACCARRRWTSCRSCGTSSSAT